ncbi:hypothetical protein SH668x_000537 [Planctomicrobium sp. SH668]|uniref:EF-hand domain-containing protein n=1 Tax=Planctomicrobium sp. SH668 TaxID=3448126 RepID=UPI003F5BC007
MRSPFRLPMFVLGMAFLTTGAQANDEIVVTTEQQNAVHVEETTQTERNSKGDQPLRERSKPHDSMFDRLDKDKDGQLSREEFEAGSKSFHLRLQTAHQKSAQSRSGERSIAKKGRSHRGPHQAMHRGKFYHQRFAHSPRMNEYRHHTNGGHRGYGSINRGHHGARKFAYGPSIEHRRFSQYGSHFGHGHHRSFQHPHFGQRGFGGHYGFQSPRHYGDFSFERSYRPGGQFNFQRRPTRDGYAAHGKNPWVRGDHKPGDRHSEHFGGPRPEARPEPRVKEEAKTPKERPEVRNERGPRGDRHPGVRPEQGPPRGEARHSSGPRPERGTEDHSERFGPPQRHGEDREFGPGSGRGRNPGFNRRPGGEKKPVNAQKPAVEEPADESANQNAEKPEDRISSRPPVAPLPEILVSLNAG